MEPQLVTVGEYAMTNTTKATRFNKKNACHYCAMAEAVPTAPAVPTTTAGFKKYVAIATEHDYNRRNIVIIKNTSGGMVAVNSYHTEKIKSGEWSVGTHSIIDLPENFSGKLVIGETSSIIAGFIGNEQMEISVGSNAHAYFEFSSGMVDSLKYCNDAQSALTAIACENLVVVTPGVQSIDIAGDGKWENVII